MSDAQIVRLESASKKFCKSLKRTMYYGVSDIANSILGIKSDRTTLRKEEFWAIKHVSFELGKGECLGLIGQNGAGKSTLLKMLNGILVPDVGRVRITGSVGALIEVGAGFHPLLTGRENIYVNGSILGMSKKEIDANFSNIVQFSEIGEFIDTAVKFYSSGMYVRLGFSIAAHLNPGIFLVDEILAVGDLSFQRKCIKFILSYLRKGGSVIFTSHNMDLVQSVCKRGLLLKKGAILSEGCIDDVIRKYQESQWEVEDETKNKGCEGKLESNDIVIKEVCFEAGIGCIAKTGDSLKITIICYSKVERNGIAWGFSLWSNNMEVRITSCSSNWSEQKYNIHIGENRFSCLIPDVPLIAGNYKIRVGIYDAETSWPIVRLGWDESPLSFKVRSSVNEAVNRQLVAGDILKLNVNWF